MLSDNGAKQKVLRVLGAIREPYEALGAMGVAPKPRSACMALTQQGFEHSDKPFKFCKLR